MVNEGCVRPGTALLLVFFLVISTTPISAAGLSSRTEVIGTVSGAGNIQLRGVSVDHEGSLFAGDNLGTGTKSYARLIFKNGSKFELFSDTKCVVNQQNQGADVRVLAGNLGFAAGKAPVAIHVGSYEVMPQPGTTGGVAFLGGDFAGIRVISGGSVRVRNLRTQQTVQVGAGDVQIVDVRTEKMNVPLAQVASTVPVPIPANSQQNPTPAPTARPNEGINWAVWGPVIAGIGAGGAIIIYEATKGSSSPSK